MPERVTLQHLGAAVDRLNDVFGFPRNPYASETDTNEGTFFVEVIATGYKLCQMRKGIEEPKWLVYTATIDSSFVILDIIRAYTDGAVAMKERQNA